MSDALPSQLIPPRRYLNPLPQQTPPLNQKTPRWSSLLGWGFIVYKLHSSDSFLKGTGAIWVASSLLLANEFYCWKKGELMGDQKKITRCFYASSIPVALMTAKASLDYLSAIDCIVGSVFATSLLCHLVGKNGTQEFLNQFIRPAAFYDRITLLERSPKESFVQVAIRTSGLIATVAMSSAIFVQTRESQAVYKYLALFFSTELGLYVKTFTGVLLNSALYHR